MARGNKIIDAASVATCLHLPSRILTSPLGLAAAAASAVTSAAPRLPSLPLPSSPLRNPDSPSPTGTATGGRATLTGDGSEPPTAEGGRCGASPPPPATLPHQSGVHMSSFFNPHEGASSYDISPAATSSSGPRNQLRRLLRRASSDLASDALSNLEGRTISVPAPALKVERIRPPRRLHLGSPQRQSIEMCCLCCFPAHQNVSSSVTLVGYTYYVSRESFQDLN